MEGFQTRVVTACVQCRVFWYAGVEPPGCADPVHDHQRHQVHRHRSPIALPDGTEVVAASFDPLDSYGRDHQPDYGLYLDRRWQPPWPHGRLDWPDFGVPADQTHMITALKSVQDRARSGQRVEIGCVGGHGRTGTVLACLAILSDHPPADAVAWVRDHYCEHAVETPEQVALIDRLHQTPLGIGEAPAWAAVTAITRGRGRTPSQAEPLGNTP